MAHRSLGEGGRLVISIWQATRLPCNSTAMLALPLSRSILSASENSRD